jgi:hypothetical protein
MSGGVLSLETDRHDGDASLCPCVRHNLLADLIVVASSNR